MMKRDFRARWYDRVSIWLSKWDWWFIVWHTFFCVVACALFLACLYIILAIAG